MPLFAAVVLLTGCWTQLGFGPEHRYHNPNETGLTVANVATLAQAWSVTTDGSVSEPIVSDGRVYVTNAANTSATGGTPQARVLALGATSGTTDWSTSLTSLVGRFVVGPVPVTKVGDELWAGYSASTFLAPPACVAEHARLATDGAVLAQGAERVSAATATSEVAVRYSAPSSCGTAARLVAYDVATAQPLWTADPAGQLGIDIPMILGDTVYIAAGTGLQAYPLAGCGQPECAPAWSVDLGIFPGQPVGGRNGEVYVTAGSTGDRALVALSATDGSELWRAPLGTDGGEIAVGDRAVYVATFGSSDSLQAFDPAGCGAATCTPLWTASLGSDAVAPPVVAGDVVYVGHDDAMEVVAFDAGGCDATVCSPLVTLPLPDPFRAMSVAEGKLFVVGTTVQGSFPAQSVTSSVTAFTPEA